jgi:hypothetical protein
VLTDKNFREDSAQILRINAKVDEEKNKNNFQSEIK